MQFQRRQSGFSLIELLTVMAVSVILLTIISVPVIQSFNLTRAAQGFADAQDKARNLISKIENEIANSATVRDNTGLKGSIAVHLPGLDGVDQRILLANTKLDLFRPAAGNPLFPNTDPYTGKIDPTLSTPKGNPILPAAAGDTMVRYFIGLRDPFSAYRNPFVQYRKPAAGGPLWLGTQSGQDNLYVLYRAEVPVYSYKNIGGVLTRVPNAAYFLDQGRLAGGGTGPLLDDPDFLNPAAGLPQPTYGIAYPGDPATRADMIRNWLRAARIVTDISRYDMIMPLINKANNQVVFTGNLPQVVPTVRFQPNRVTSEPAAGQLAVRSGEETVNAEKIGADIFSTQYGAWANVSMSIWPSVYPATFGPGNVAGLTNGAPRAPWNGGKILRTGTDAVGDVQIYGDTVPLFNLSGYQRAKSAGLTVPFTRAVQPGAAIAPWNLNFIPMVPDPKTGQVKASFDIREFGDPAAAIAYANNIPTNDPAKPGILTGPTLAPSDPAYQAGSWFTFTTINERFNRLWNVWDTLFPAGNSTAKEGPQGVKRYIDLRQMNQGALAGFASPLSPVNQVGRAYITPGAEVIYGPDQAPGPNYGALVRYTRVPNVDSISVGPNQYKINYVDKPEPDWTLFGFAAPNYDPFAYNPTDFLSAVLQARYRAGYVEFNSRFGEPLPSNTPNAIASTGNIYVTYRFQFTEPSDAVAVDYDSAQLMDVVLTIRNYPQSDLPNPQITTVRGSAAVRNYIR